MNGEINSLFHRLHIIYFRSYVYAYIQCFIFSLMSRIYSIEHPTTLLTPALLKWCRKRYYANYTYVRTSTIFPNREALLAYEEALRMEAVMECMLEGELDEDDVIEAFDKWAARNSEAKENEIVPTESDDDYDPNDIEIVPNPAQAEPDIEQNADPEKKETQAAFNARRVLRVFHRVYPRWQQLCRLRSAEATQIARTNGLSRFDEGWILTRIVFKGTRYLSCRC